MMKVPLPLSIIIHVEPECLSSSLAVIVYSIIGDKTGQDMT